MNELSLFCIDHCIRNDVLANIGLHCSLDILFLPLEVILLKAILNRRISYLETIFLLR